MLTFCKPSVNAHQIAQISTGNQDERDWSFLSRKSFCGVVSDYLSKRHPKFREKALITATTAQGCLAVLNNPEDKTIHDAQFRYWVNQTFYAMPIGDISVLYLLKTKKQVCYLENMYHVICSHHEIIGHGGRDKTAAAVSN